MLTVQIGLSIALHCHCSRVITPSRGHQIQNQRNDDMSEIKYVLSQLFYSIIIEHEEGLINASITVKCYVIICICSSEL